MDKIEIVYVEEDTFDLMSANNSPMPMADMETDSRLGYKEFKCLASCGLTLKQFHIIMLYYFCGLKQDEIARITRTSVSSVQNQVQKSKRKILKTLKK